MKIKRIKNKLKLSRNRRPAPKSARGAVAGRQAVLMHWEYTLAPKTCTGVILFSLVSAPVFAVAFSRETNPDLRTAIDLYVEEMNLLAERPCSDGGDGGSEALAPVARLDGSQRGGARASPRWRSWLIRVC